MGPGHDFHLKEKGQVFGASFKTSHFGQSLRWAQISILKILNVFSRLKCSPAFLSRILAGDLDQTETF